MAQITLIQPTERGMKSVPLDAWYSSWSSTGTSGDEVTTLYKRVPWFGRAVRRRALALSRLPRVWVVGKKESAELPSAALKLRLERTNRMLSSLLYLMETHLILYGRAYLYKEQNRFRVLTLRQPHPTTVVPEYDTTYTQVIAYQRMGIESARWTPDEVVAVWEPNAESEIMPGAAPALLAADAAGALRSGSEMINKAFANGVFAPTLLIEKTGRASKDDMERLEGWFRRAASGLRNVGRALGLSGDVEVRPLTMIDLDKMAVEGLTSQKREDVATALGIPQTLLFSNAANYATAQEDSFTFYDQTVVPQAEMIAEALNEQLFQSYGIELKFKPGELEVYQARESAKAYRVVELYQSGIVTLNETRGALNYTPVPNGDELLPTPAAAAEAAQASAAATAAEAQAKVQEFSGAGRRSEPSAADSARRERRRMQPGARGRGSSQVSQEIAKEKAAGEAKSSELGRWERMALRRLDEGSFAKSFAFEPEALSADEAGAVKALLRKCGDADDVKAAFVIAEMRMAVKGEESYLRSIRSLIRGLWRELISGFDFVDGMYSAIRREYRAAFEEGLARAGATWDGLTLAQQQRLEDAINREATYITGLMNDILQQRATGSIDAFYTRAEMWMSRLDGIRNLGWLVGSGDQKMMWVRNPDKESCTDCIKLDGRVYRASTWLRWDIVPGSAKLECFGTFCGCAMQATDEPLTRGRPPAWLYGFAGKSADGTNPFEVTEADGIEIDEAWEAANNGGCAEEHQHGAPAERPA